MSFNPFGPRVTWADVDGSVWEYTLNPETVEAILLSHCKDHRIPGQEGDDGRTGRARRHAYSGAIKDLIHANAEEAEGSAQAIMEHVRECMGTTQGASEGYIPLYLWPGHGDVRHEPEGWRALFKHKVEVDRRMKLVVVNARKLEDRVNDEPPETCIKLSDCTWWCDDSFD